MDQEDGSNDEAHKPLITSEWFLPHFPPRTERPLELMMTRKWQEFASYEDDFNNYWQTRLESMLKGIPRALHLRSGRIAATFMLWIITNNGRGFLHTFYREQGLAQAYSKEETAVTSLAKENMLGIVQNLLENLLRNEHGKHVYNENPFPTLEDYRVVEMLCIFLGTDTGRKFLRNVFEEDGNLKFLPTTF